jgi:hypothetical protein
VKCLLAEDLTGQGHCTRVVGDEPYVYGVLVVQEDHDHDKYRIPMKRQTFEVLKKAPRDLWYGATKRIRRFFSRGKLCVN